MSIGRSVPPTGTGVSGAGSAGKSKEPPTMKQLIQRELASCYQVQAPEKPVKVHQLEDTNMISYDA